jgi:geranylgeranylglycerol-phosphate geranylgeranyltransferase
VFDLDFDGIIDRFLMYWQLLRVKNGIIAFFGVLVGGTFVYASGTPVEWAPVLMAGFVAFIVTGAGNALNDYFDYEIDKINRPDRPIPSGKISRSDVLMVSAVLFLVGWGLSKSINDYCFAIAFLNSAILIFYAKYSKKVLFVSNLSISFLVCSLFAFGVAATIQRNVDVVGIEELILVAIVSSSAFSMTLAREIIKDIEDIKGDMEKYAKTLPISIGEEKAKKMAALFTAIAICISLTPFILPLGTFNLLIYGIIIIAADLIFIASLLMEPAIGQRIMIIGMVFALLAFFLGNMIRI